MPEMDAKSEDTDSNYTLAGTDCLSCPASIANWNLGNYTNNFNWRKYIWQFVSICSCIVSIACLATLVCLTTNPKQGTSSSEIRHCTAQLNKLNRTVQKIQKKLAAFEKRGNRSCLCPSDLVPVSVPVKSPNHINRIKNSTLGCGGLIPLPPPGNSTFLDYKSQTLYNNNENCLWMLDSSTGTGKKFFAVIKISVEYEGFGDFEDGLFVFDWIEWGKLTSFDLRMSECYEDPLFCHNREKKLYTAKKSSWQFLSFTSSNRSVGTGFILRLDTLHTSDFHSGTNRAFTSSSGTLTYGPIGTRDKIAVVINPPNKSYTLTLNYLESTKLQNGSCDEHDSLHMFTVEGWTSPPLPVLCGNLANRSYTFQAPIFLGFLTLPSPTKNTFKLSWKES